MSLVRLQRVWAVGLLAVGVWLAAALPARADIIELNSGRKITGSVSRQGDLMVIRGDDGSITSVSPNEIARVTLTSNQTPAQAADSQWESLSAQIKRADDLPTIIALHEKFLQQFPDSPAAQKVTESLGVYRQLAAGDAVKFRGRWMPRNQIDITLKQWAEDARPAVELYHAGKLKEALDAAKGIIAKDNLNPDALAVAGLAGYRSNNLAQARVYFTALATADPGSVLAQNNLGVISYQQKAAGEGLIHYTKALQALSANRLALDNAAEAINAYSGDKNSSNYRALIGQFQQAELTVEAEMGKQGLHRWGSTWVTGDQLLQLEKNQRAVKDLMAQLDAQYRAANETLATIDGQLAQMQHDSDGYASTINTYTAQLLLTSQAVDQAVLMAQRDVAIQNLDHAAQYKTELETQRKELMAESANYFKAADSLKAALAAAEAQYTGVQRIMDLGEADNPPAPVAVVVWTELPQLPPPPVAFNPPPPLPPAGAQTIVTIPVPVLVVPTNGVGGR